ncbi:MAG: DNA-directed RNA polymerase subunit D [Candidatus Woesearchaeota archaeon]
MKISKISSVNEKAVFSMSKTSPGFVNALRRYAVDYVPTLAIEDVEIVQNNSLLYDEVFAHRLGLIPLKTDLSVYTLPQGEEITAANSVVLTLKAENKGVVYAKDLVSKDPSVVAAYGEIPIVQLIDNQQVECVATAVMGQGKTHAKWAPCNAFYTYAYTVDVKNASPSADILAKYPPQVVVDGKINKDAITTPVLVDACDGVDDSVVTVSYATDAFEFVIESFGQLKPEAILVEACNQFLNDITTVLGLVKEIKH